MNYKTLMVSLVSITLLSCSSSRFITQESTYTNLGLDLSSDSISILDERSFISSEDDIRLPILSVPGQAYDFYPKLSPAYKNIIHTTVMKNIAMADSSIDSKLTIYVLDARKEFSATVWSEYELVVIKLKLVVRKNGTTKEITETGEFYRKSMDAKLRTFEELFQNSLRETTYNGLKKLKD